MSDVMATAIEKDRQNINYAFNMNQ